MVSSRPIAGSGGGAKWRRPEGSVNAAVSRRGSGGGGFTTKFSSDRRKDEPTTDGHSGSSRRGNPSAGYNDEEEGCGSVLRWHLR